MTNSQMARLGLNDHLFHLTKDVTKVPCERSLLFIGPLEVFFNITYFIAYIIFQDIAVVKGAIPI